MITYAHVLQILDGQLMVNSENAETDLALLEAQCPKLIHTCLDLTLAA